MALVTSMTNLNGTQPSTSDDRLKRSGLLPWLGQAVDEVASDLFLSVGEPPILRIYGSFKRIGQARLMADDLSRIIEAVLPDTQREQFRQGREVDLGLEIPGLTRFRVNIFREHAGSAIAIRPLPLRIPTLEELELPPILRDLSQYRRGLILITGPAGSGKTTTLAAFIDTINREQERHIITLEDPIEYVIPNRRSLIHQREVGLHTRSFADGLRSALRENPDVIVVGELRDAESTALALRAAETGHLVLGTLHSGTAAQTITRILDVLEPEQQKQARIQLAQSLQAIVSQRLLKRRDGSGMIVASEVLMASWAVRSLIRQNKPEELHSAMQTGGTTGMHTLGHSIQSLIDRELVGIESIREVNP